MTPLITAAVLYGGLSILWAVSVKLKDASLVDPFWGISFMVIGWTTALQTGLSPGKVLQVGVLSLWALRLFSHLMPRFLRHSEEDPRYQAFREKYGPERYWWVSYFQVFLLQGSLAMLVAAPIWVGTLATEPDAIGFWQALGAGIALLGIATEAIADRQLTAYRADRSPDKPRVLDTGLWRYSRHPNYFGNAVLWWGLGVMVLDHPWGGLALLGPALMTFLLVKVSGVAMLDAQLSRTRPGYKDYMARTSGFVPWFPKQS